MGQGGWVKEDGSRRMGQGGWVKEDGRRRVGEQRGWAMADVSGCLELIRGATVAGLPPLA
eukprot:CAMPEP_0174760296 /NCGR_PEP_ID=MMETSP1094-20130205/108700_1 /TAXON_ID=156173 /ORGANISM="Chrysochromulina brevifilum, Strain UTEX LB 985" /LENGTH=59 /DNA_ID=CAMNT_0015966237 /DNA_START=535 /DNA_END=714 /DNA_ORIENTATION=-